MLIQKIHAMITLLINIISQKSIDSYPTFLLNLLSAFSMKKQEDILNIAIMLFILCLVVF